MDLRAMNEKRFNELMRNDDLPLTPEELKQGYHFCYEFDGLLRTNTGEEFQCDCLKSIPTLSRTLVNALRAINQDSSYLAVWHSYQIHGGKYQGPFYVDELNALESALNEQFPDITISTATNGSNPSTAVDAL